MRTYRRPKTDPELLRQINSSVNGRNSIQAVFSLDRTVPTPDAHSVEDAANRVLGRVESNVGYKPGWVSVFKELGSFTVFADALFIREIIADPEIGFSIAGQNTA